MMTTLVNSSAQVVYWHRELPPLTAEIVGEHTLEADSRRVALAFSRGDEEWARCYGDLMTCARTRLEQEVVRLGGHYAHVRHEIVHPRHDEAAGEAWLYGRFDYVLYREPANVAY
jgi:hypothetical protein